RESLVNAFSAIEDSTQQRVRKLLLVTGDTERQRNLESILAGSDLEISSAINGGQALAVIGQNYLDGIVIHVRLSDIPAVELIREIQTQLGRQAPPVVLYSKRALTSDEASALRDLGRNSLVKHAQSPERLLDEVVLLLHRAESNLSEIQRETLADIRRN